MATAGELLPAVAMFGITKKFPGVIANHDVDFVVRRGEVHALLGENGAGKSTLSNVLTGLYRPDAGRIELDGVEVDLSSPKVAIEHGIGMVHQHFRLVNTFTVAENIELGKSGAFKPQQAERRIAAWSEEIGLPIDPAAKIWELSVGQQQRVEILKALDRNASVLILDEPTAVLTPGEAESLFENLRSMVALGRSVIFISHKLEEVLAVSDRVTVLRDGTDVGCVETTASDSRSLARLMVGRDVVMSRDDTHDRSNIDTEVEALRLDGVSASNDRGEPVLRPVSFVVHPGEIVGIVGVAGNGQRELAETICGLRQRSSGTVSVLGRELAGKSPREAIQAGVSYVPEDRLKTGLAASATIEDNLVLKSYRHRPFSVGPFMRRRAVRSHAGKMIEQYDVKAPGTATSTRLLSGGNVQKVLLAREMSSDPVVLIAASPTRGLDVGAIEVVRSLLLTAVRNGLGLVLITEDLEEAMALSDRLLVMFDGAIHASFSRDDFDVEEIGLAMGGHVA